MSNPFKLNLNFISIKTKSEIVICNNNPKTLRKMTNYYSTIIKG